MVSLDRGDQSVLTSLSENKEGFKSEPILRECEIARETYVGSYQETHSQSIEHQRMGR
jgi:hypothetical protein